MARCNHNLTKEVWCLCARAGVRARACRCVCAGVYARAMSVGSAAARGTKTRGILSGRRVAWVVAVASVAAYRALLAGGGRTVLCVTRQSSTREM